MEDEETQCFQRSEETRDTTTKCHMGSEKEQQRTLVKF